MFSVCLSVHHCGLIATRSELSSARVAFLLLAQNCQEGSWPSTEGFLVVTVIWSYI